MSTMDVAGPGAGTTDGGGSGSFNPELDLIHLQTLPKEQQELFLLNFVSRLSRHVLSLDKDDCTAQQFYLKKEVFKLLKLPSPSPTRVIRQNLGRCLSHVFEHGDRKLLFETINELVALVSGSSSPGSSSAATSKSGAAGAGASSPTKVDEDAQLRMRHAAVHCLGEVYAGAGDSAIGLHAHACGALIKLGKSSTAQAHAGLRAAVLSALSKIVRMVGSSIDEGVARDVWKQARSQAGSGDKTGGLVIVAACGCLKSLVQRTRYFDGASDFDSLKSTLFKAIESSLPVVRRAAADCLAAAMVKSYSETGAAAASAATPSKKAKSKSGKKGGSGGTGGAGEDDEVPSQAEGPAPGSASTRKADLTMTLADILRTVTTQYVRMSTSNRARIALGICLGRVLRQLGERVVQAHYVRLVETLSVDVLGSSSIANNRYRLLVSRRMVDVLLRRIIGGTVLGETGQMNCARSIVSDILKNYPQALKERPEPTKQTLVVALSALAGLVRALGSAAHGLADACRDGLLQVLQHPSYTVQVHAAACLKTLALACPQQLLPCLSVCMNSLSRELGQLAGPSGGGGGGRHLAARRCVGFAHGLAATMSVSPQRPLHGSVDVNSRVLTMATNLLKSSGRSELHASATQIQVAWILIGGLMSLGPSFVKIHLSQLLLLWKNALPKPLAKDNTAHRGYLEASFLLHVRECALGSILAFLQYNTRLLTVDVSKRIATMLQSTTAFLKTLPSKKTTEDVSQRLQPALQLLDLEMMVQRRVMQCYIKLMNQGPAGGSEALLQSNLLTLAISQFADPENYSANSLTASIANAAGTFDTIWDVGDQSGFGVTGLVRGFRLRGLPGQQESASDPSSSVFEDGGAEEDMERLLSSPVCTALEHDAAVLYTAGPDESDPAAGGDLPDPPATEVVNMAIQLFAFVFPLTPAKVQESVLEQIATFVSAGSLQRDPGRKAAINVNVAMAVLSTLTVATRETRSPPGDVTNLAVEKLLQDMVRDWVIDPDQYVRAIGYAAAARLCSACGNAFTNHEIKYLVDTIIVNREPSARAGCAMALGCIQTKVGSMSAGYHLKTILGILMSLCNDPHPTVHFWALEALARASEAAGLAFSSYVSASLGMLAQLYVSDTHHAESAALAGYMNLELELSTTAALAHCLDALINVLGPDLQEGTRSRELIFTLVGQLQREDDVAVQRASLVCLEHLSLYAPGYVDFRAYVRLLQQYLASDRPALRDAAVDGLYNLMKRDASDVVAAAEKGYEDQLWLVLDTCPDHDGLRNLIRNWMRQTCLADTARWLHRFQAVLKMTRASAAAKSRAASDESRDAAAGKKVTLPDLRDEEVAGFANAGGGASGGPDEAKDASAAGEGAVVGPEVEPLRWQVRVFTMSLLCDLFQLVAREVASKGESPAQTALQQRVADVVRMAFSASTAGVLELRIWGLKLVGCVLRMFGRTPDPDFEEAMLLEQYQAQISSALTPAFAADSSPELASEAVNVCALFIATGIVTDVDRMGRILRTLVTALDGFRAQDENAGIGDLKGLSANAQVMVKMSVFAAWAELQVASSEQPYLLDVLRPHIGPLTPLWLESLREFARLRFEPDISMTLGPPSLSGSLDTIYAALNRETLLRFYQDSWLKLVDAIASLIEQDSEFVFDALDGKEGEPNLANGSKEGSSGAVASKKAVSDINYRDEPVAFFFVLFGLAFEALATRPGQGSGGGSGNTSSAAHSGSADYSSLASHEQTLNILSALKKILHPSVSGHAIYRDAIFSETMDLLDRLVLTEGLDVQSVIVEIARNLCVAHPSARKHREAEEGDLSEDIEQLFELTRIIVLVLSGLLPGLGPDSSSGAGSAMTQQVRHPQMTEEAVLVVRTSLSALVDAAEVFPTIIRTDLHACIIHIFATVLATPSCQDVIVPQALPIFKRFVATMVGRDKSQRSHQTDVQLQGCLRRFLSIYLDAQKREEPHSLARVKNCLLATTVLFTASPGTNNLPATDPLVARYLDEVVDCLTDRMVSPRCVSRVSLCSYSPSSIDLRDVLHDG